ncbi:MAG: M23 family metallopeptidase [Oligoflexia bacterium]|nr:M23 family metallopeptidase [Oligoflexia bacterium]
MKKHSSYLRAALSSVALAALILATGLPAASISGQPNSFVYPLVGTRISSKFGLRNHPIYHVSKHHGGIDLAAPSGAPVRAIAPGVVIFADPYAGYGNLVVVRHGGGMTSHYGHLKEIKVRPGQKVLPGQILATVGATGHVTGPHLHFEVRLDGKTQNPENYIKGLALEAAG